MESPCLQSAGRLRNVCWQIRASPSVRTELCHTHHCEVLKSVPYFTWLTSSFFLFLPPDMEDNDIALNLQSEQQLFMEATLRG